MQGPQFGGGQYSDSSSGQGTATWQLLQLHTVATNNQETQTLTTRGRKGTSKGNISKTKISDMERERRQLEADIHQLTNEKTREKETEKGFKNLLKQQMRIGNIQTNSKFRSTFQN